MRKRSFAMRSGKFSLCVLAALAVSVCLLGCGSDSADTPVNEDGGTPPVSAPATEQAGHEGHDHGHEGEHAHPTEGPHGGHLIELGDEQYHAELLHDEASHTVSVHILDAAGKMPVAIRQETVTLQVFQDGKFVDYALKPAGETGEAGVSEFAIVSQPLTVALLHAESVRGRLRVTIDGNEYTGVVEHAAHDHAGHAH